MMTTCDHFRELETPSPAPMPDSDVQDAVQRTIEDFAGVRRLASLGDGAVQVHLIARLASWIPCRPGGR